MSARIRKRCKVQRKPFFRPTKNKHNTKEQKTYSKDAFSVTGLKASSLPGKESRGSPLGEEFRSPFRCDPGPAVSPPAFKGETVLNSAKIVSNPLRVSVYVPVCGDGVACQHRGPREFEVRKVSGMC